MASEKSIVERGGRATEHGRANERTALAWNRSAISIAATAGLIAKSALDEGSPWLGLVGFGVLLLIAAAVSVYGAVLRRRGPLLSPRLAMGSIAAASVLTGVIACLVVFLA